MTDFEMVLRVSAAGLATGNDPVIAHGLAMLAALPGDVDSVTFGVQYELVDDAAPERWSSVDIVTVTREGAVSA